MHAVAARTLLTDKGKSLVRSYADTGDAQRMCSLLQRHASKSTMASIDGSVLIGCITTAKLGTGTNWRGSTHSFILHWQDQVRKYVALNPQKNALQDSFLLAMLQNAVNPVEELRIVKTQAEQMSVRDGKHLSYEQYVSLLLSAAQALDGHYTTKVNT